MLPHFITEVGLFVVSSVDCKRSVQGSCLRALVDARLDRGELVVFHALRAM